MECPTPRSISSLTADKSRQFLQHRMLHLSDPRHARFLDQTCVQHSRAPWKRVSFRVPFLTEGAGPFSGRDPVQKMRLAVTQCRECWRHTSSENPKLGMRQLREVEHTYSKSLHRPSSKAINQSWSCKLCPQLKKSLRPNQKYGSGWF